MRRREFIGLVGGTAVWWPVAVRAQQSGRMPVVGVFWAYPDAEDRLSFLKGLADLGYIPGKTFILEERYANGGPGTPGRSCYRVSRPQRGCSGQPSR